MEGQGQGYDRQPRRPLITPRIPLKRSRAYQGEMDIYRRDMAGIGSFLLSLLYEEKRLER